MILMKIFAIIMSILLVSSVAPQEELTITNMIVDSVGMIS